jgi:hypothetical protein
LFDVLKVENSGLPRCDSVAGSRFQGKTGNTSQVIKNHIPEDLNHSTALLWKPQITMYLLKVGYKP